MDVMCFYCDFCKDKIARTRKGLRLHLKTHVRNQLMNTKPMKEGDFKSVKQNWWHKEKFK